MPGGITEGSERKSRRKPDKSKEASDFDSLKTIETSKERKRGRARRDCDVDLRSWPKENRRLRGRGDLRIQYINRIGWVALTVTPSAPANQHYHAGQSNPSQHTWRRSPGLPTAKAKGKAQRRHSCPGPSVRCARVGLSQERHRGEAVDTM